jgi:SAM-dependent methyltransferase
LDSSDRSVSIDENQLQGLVKLAKGNVTDFFLSATCRRYIAMKRWVKSGRHVRIFEDPSSGVMPGTIAYNRGEVEQDLFGSSRRTQRLIGPLSGLEPVYSVPERLKALSIGPRTEMELLHLMGIGFVAENLRAVDLIASSPLMDLGDMHHLPYGDREFDVVISGWVLTYSKDPARAVREMVRVCKNGGLIAIGVSSAPQYPEGYIADPKQEKEVVGSMFRSGSAFAAMIGPNLATVHFQQDASSDVAPTPVTFIARIRHD